jgi:hypothetical protein
METQQLTSVGGLMQHALTSPVNGFEDLGAGVVDVSDLPTPDPFRYRLFSFITSGAASESFSLTKGGSTTVYFGDGTSSSNSPTISKTYDTSSVPSGTVFSVTTDELFRFGFDTGNSSSSIQNLNGLEFYWDSLTSLSSNLKLENLGITQPMPKWNNGSNVLMSTVNLKGNSIPGKFPSNISAVNLFIQENNFTGELPSVASGTKKYQVQGNAFEGSIHDLSSNTTIEAYLAYGQDDGNTYDRVNNPKIMLTGEIPNLSGATSLNFYHVGAGEPWNRGFKNDLSLASDFDVTNKLSRFYASNCQLSTAEIDKLLNAFANTSTISPNIIDISGSNGYPTPAGLADKDTLVASGWTINLPTLD